MALLADAKGIDAKEGRFDPLRYIGPANQVYQWYNQFTGRSDTGIHGYTVELNSFKNERMWRYAGRNKYLFRSAALDVKGRLIYRTLSDSNPESKEEFTIGRETVADVALEKRDYICPSSATSDQRSWSNSDGFEILKSDFDLKVAHKIVSSPGSAALASFKKYGIYSTLQAQAAVRSALCRTYSPQDFIVRSEFVVNLGGSTIVRFSSPANFEIESPTAIYGGLSSSVFP